MRNWLLHLILGGKLLGLRCGQDEPVVAIACRGGLDDVPIVVHQPRMPAPYAFLDAQRKAGGDPDRGPHPLPQLRAVPLAGACLAKSHFHACRRHDHSIGQQGPEIQGLEGEHNRRPSSKQIWVWATRLQGSVRSRLSWPSLKWCSSTSTSSPVHDTCLIRSKNVLPGTGCRRQSGLVLRRS